MSRKFTLKYALSIDPDDSLPGVMVWVCLVLAVFAISMFLFGDSSKDKCEAKACLAMTHTENNQTQLFPYSSFENCQMALRSASRGRGRSSIFDDFRHTFFCIEGEKAIEREKD